MKLISNESVISKSTNNAIVLTNYRLFHNAGRFDFASIMVDKISSIQVKHISHFWLLVSGILFGLGIIIGAFDYHLELFGIGSGIIGLALIILFFSTRKHVISVSPDGGHPINFTTRGMSKSEIKALISKIEKSALDLKLKHEEPAYQLKI